MCRNILPRLPSEGCTGFMPVKAANPPIIVTSMLIVQMVTYSDPWDKMSENAISATESDLECIIVLKNSGQAVQ